MRLALMTIAFVGVAGAPALRAQTPPAPPIFSRLEGVVADTAGRPIASAQVTILHTAFTALTDSAISVNRIPAILRNAITSAVIVIAA